MAFDVNEVTETATAVELGERLWLDADGNVVKDDDPSATELLGPAGYRLPRDEAIRLGLVKPTADEKKQLAAGEAGSAPDEAVASEESQGLTKEKRASANKQRSRASNK